MVSRETMSRNEALLVVGPFQSSKIAWMENSRGAYHGPDLIGNGFPWMGEGMEIRFSSEKRSLIL